ncbi:unnamed protein product [Cyprideis torosa]|uniref:Uncharacterized protein n=1 Tax=Cyprideis torosa TaxID=163714 RepID=A0A7R8W6V2_9CRUS|nr:unnamed protein product [Cyprideis torosa]CAG0886903.1 unnamed protein product [Cyprideis torosa]
MEGFLLLAKTARGAAALNLTNQVLETPGIYCFAELMEMPNIRELANDPSTAPMWSLLEIFAWGKYCDYESHQSSLPPLNVNQLKKLRHLTIVSLSKENKLFRSFSLINLVVFLNESSTTKDGDLKAEFRNSKAEIGSSVRRPRKTNIPYAELQAQVGCTTVRELEDLLISAIYSGVVRGELNPRERVFSVRSAIGRDVQRSELPAIMRTLEDWCSACEALLGTIDSQITTVNQKKAQHLAAKQALDDKVAEIRRNMKLHRPDDAAMDADVPAAGSEKPKKKGYKMTKASFGWGNSK